MHEELNKFIEEANNIVIFTGAGISTESGIPDFRGPQGIWKTITPIYFQDFVDSEDVCIGVFFLLGIIVKTL